MPSKESANPLNKDLRSVPRTVSEPNGSTDTTPILGEVSRPSVLPEADDQGLMPHTTISITKATEDLIKGAETVVEEAVNWIEQKANDLKLEEDIGPYSSPGTCAPSDLDPLANGAMPVPSVTKTADDNDVENTKDDEPSKQTTGLDGGRKMSQPEGKK